MAHVVGNGGTLGDVNHGPEVQKIVWLCVWEDPQDNSVQSCNLIAEGSPSVSRCAPGAKIAAN